MATYTIELRHVAGLVDVPKLYLSKYPIFDEGYRTPLNQKILDHYWTREIGQETIDMWGFYLRRKMNEIMPVYNELYKTTRLEYDPLSTMDITNLSVGESESISDGESEAHAQNRGSSESRVIGSEYPQSQLSGSEDYATSGTDSTALSTGRDTSTGKTRQKGHGKTLQESRSRGRSQSGASLVMEYRAAILNVDMMVISELEPLFMQIFGNADFEPGEPYMASILNPLNPYYY